MLAPAGALFGAFGLASSTAAATGGSVVLQSVSCADWQQVPANYVPDAPLDDTAGHYRQWGPVDGDVVQPLGPESLPQGCALVDGVSFRVSGTPYGNGLVPGAAAGPYPAEATAVLDGTTGDDGAGTLRTSVGRLSEPQRASLVNGVGLWVEALDLPGDFANLRCHADRYHADNLEVIRAGSSDQQVTCVLYVVQRAVTPVPAPVTPVVPVSPVVVVPPSVTEQPVVPEPPSPVTGTETNAVVVAPTESGSVAVLPESGLSAQPSGSSSAVAPVSIGIDPLAAARLAGVQVRLTVRKVGVGPLAAAWAQPTVVVDYSCADQHRRLSVERGPGSALSAVLALPVGTVCRLSVAGPPAVGGLRPLISVDAAGVAAGEAVLVAVDERPVPRLVDVRVDLPGLEDETVVTAEPAAAEPAPGTELAWGTAEIPRSRMSAELAVGLGAVFLAGLGLSVLAARRPL